MAETTRERLRRLERAVLTQAVEPITGMAFVGMVTGSPPATMNKFFKVIPMTVWGPESSGATPTLIQASTTTVPVYVIGNADSTKSVAPQVGDYLICRSVNYRWVATWKKTPPTDVAQCHTGNWPSTMHASWTGGSIALTFNSTFLDWRGSGRYNAPGGKTYGTELTFGSGCPLAGSTGPYTMSVSCTGSPARAACLISYPVQQCSNFPSIRVLSFGSAVGNGGQGTTLTSYSESPLNMTFSLGNPTSGDTACQPPGTIITVTA